MNLDAKDFPEDAGDSFVLIGNVNTGKSTIFNRLCRKNVREGNYPGTTTTVACGSFSEKDHTYRLIDTPGANTIYAENEDELISKQVILEGRASHIILVADAKNLKRSLAMYLHYIEYGLPVILDINMMDEAAIRNIDIDVALLSHLLDTEVNTSVAIEGGGIGALKRKLPHARQSTAQVAYPEFITNYLRMADQISGRRNIPRGILLSLLTDDGLAWEYMKTKCGPGVIAQMMRLVHRTRLETSRPADTVLVNLYMAEADRICAETVRVSPMVTLPFADRLGFWSRTPLTGIPIALAIIVLMFLFVGEFGAEFLVGLLEGDLFGGVIVPFVTGICDRLPHPIIARGIVGEYGLLSVGLSLAIGVVMPVLLTFYFFFGILESSGYLPRLAILLNRVFKIIGMSGKGVLPMIMGFSCITMAILTTRVLESNKEKNIATFLLVQGIPCAPLFSVMLVLLANMAPWTYFFVFGVIALKLFVTGYFVNKIFKGQQPEFIMEVPPLRIPRLKGIAVNAVRRTYLFLKEAIPVFLFATFIVFVLDEVGAHTLLENVSEPLLTGLVGLPKESVNIFLMSFIRREAGVALLTDLVDRGLFTQIQIVVNLLLISFLIPCVNAILVMVKERGGRTAAAICGFVLVYAILLGALINRLLLACQSIGIIA